MHNNAWPPESLHSPRKWSFDKQEYLSLCPPGRCLISCRFLVLHSPLFCSREGLFTSTMQAVRTDSWMHSFWSCFPPHPPPFFQDMNSPRATLGLLLQKLWQAQRNLPRSQLWLSMSLYSSGTRSGSTGLGRKWVNLWCRLDLVPSRDVPSLLRATK